MQKIKTNDNYKFLRVVCEGQKHKYHILDASAFPFLVSLFLLVLLVPTTFFLHGVTMPFGLPRREMMHLGFYGLFLTAMWWFVSIVQESNYYHSYKVQRGLRAGMLLFILSEVMLFFAFFWAFFHFSLVPSVNIGAVWPPLGTQELDPKGLPLGNTLLLLYSGLTVTYAHAYLVNNQPKKFLRPLVLTIILGMVFLACQAYEYKYGVKFSWRENIYGSVFFLTTGFHGLHVTVGTLFLMFCFGRQVFPTLLTAWRPYKALWAITPAQHLGFEAAAWYWHFVDIVWLFLYISIYWWGIAG